MNRAVRAVIRLIAAGLVLFGGLEIGLEFARHRMRNADISIWHCVIGGILVALGIFLFCASTWLAEQLTDDFED